MTASDEKMIQTTEEIFNSVAHGTYNIDEKWIRAAALRQKIMLLTPHLVFENTINGPDDEGNIFVSRDMVLSFLTTPQPKEGE